MDEGGQRAGCLRARRTGAGTWGRPAGQRDLPSSSCRCARLGQGAPFAPLCSGESSSPSCTLGKSPSSLLFCWRQAEGSAILCSMPVTFPSL